jgi:pimeloyl-ACP methyl ester carboxylesterase
MPGVNLPTTRYTKSGDVHLAYQVVGEGDFDLVYVPGFVSNVEEAWEDPNFRRFLERLASFSRLLLFDKRGTGLSDPVSIGDLPTLEQRMDDLRAVMDAAGSKRAAIFGHSEGGVMSILFAATYPERTIALITLGTFAKRVWSPDYPWAPTPEQRELEYDEIDRTWGRQADIGYYAPSMEGDEAFASWFARYLRRSASPQAALALMRMNTQADIRDVLVERHHTAIRRELARFRGREIDTAGDGFLATFDGPARAIRCAIEATRVVRQLGLEIHAGVHTGEVELVGDKVRGSRCISDQGLLRSLTPVRCSHRAP